MITHEYIVCFVTTSLFVLFFVLVPLILLLLFLLQALYQLYFDPDMEHKNVAQKWLTQAQGSAQAWQFCWALLDPDKVCC